MWRRLFLAGCLLELRATWEPFFSPLLLQNLQFATTYRRLPTASLQEISGLEARHRRETDELSTQLRRQELQFKDLQQRMQTAARRHEVSLKAKEQAHREALEGAQRAAADAAVAAEERRRLDTSVLVARMQAAEREAEEALRAVVSEHSEAMRKVCVSARGSVW